MTVKINAILAALRSVWDDVNPLGAGSSLFMYDFLEDRVHDLEAEIIDSNRQLSEALCASK